MQHQDSTHLPEPIVTTPDGQRPADLMTPGGAAPMPFAPYPTDSADGNARTTDIIPDEVPRKDGPGGEDGGN